MAKIFPSFQGTLKSPLSKTEAEKRILEITLPGTGWIQQRPRDFNSGKLFKGEIVGNSYDLYLITKKKEIGVHLPLTIEEDSEGSKIHVRIRVPVIAQVFTFVMPILVIVFLLNMSLIPLVIIGFLMVRMFSGYKRNIALAKTILIENLEAEFIETSNERSIQVERSQETTRRSSKGSTRDQSTTVHREKKRKKDRDGGRYMK